MAEEVKITKARTDLKPTTDFVWAFNKLKLKQAYSSLVDAKKFDPKLVIDEESMKDEYLKRGGLLTEEAKANLAKKRPRSTSNLDKNNKE